MTPEQYKITFSGEVILGHDQAEVRKKVSGLLKIDEEKCNRLFSGKQVLIKNGVDHETALKYQESFKKAGASCKIVPIKGDISQTAPDAREAVKDVSEATGLKMITCPNCGFLQKESEECIKCGIVIEKFKVKKARKITSREESSDAVEHEDEQKALSGDKQDPPEDMPWYQRAMDKVLPERLKQLYGKYLLRIKDFSEYLSNVADLMTRTILLVVITIIVNTGFLYFSKMMWTFYIATPVGERFITEFPVRAQAFLNVFSRVSIGFSIRVTIAAFTTCLAISAICQVLHIARYFYHSRGFFGRIILWGLPLTAVVAKYIQSGFGFGFEKWGTAYAVSLIPTLCVFMLCFKVTTELLPEIGYLIKKSDVIKTEIIKQVKQLLKR